jgi:hypothetical protein
LCGSCLPPRFLSDGTNQRRLYHVVEPALSGGDFARRVRAFARKNKIPFLPFAVGDKTKHAQAAALRPTDPNFQGVFAIFASKAPALVWKAWKNKKGKLVLRRPRNWPLVYHYHFHIVGREWGHITIRMSGHPPFGRQISLNGHEWVERQARAQGVPLVKQENCFVGGSDFPKLNQLAQTLDGPKGLAQLAGVCQRWVYSACLCFVLDGQAQRRSGFRDQYSCYPLAYSRNLLFKSGRRWDEVSQGLIERTWRQLDVPRLKTIFGRKGRPPQNRAGGGRWKVSTMNPRPGEGHPVVLAKVREALAYLLELNG